MPHLVAGPRLIIDLEDVKYAQLHIEASGDAPSHATVAFKDGQAISIDEEDYNHLVLALARHSPRKLLGVMVPITSHTRRTLDQQQPTHSQQ